MGNRLYNAILHSKDADRMANSADSDQTALSVTLLLPKMFLLVVMSISLMSELNAVFHYTCLSIYRFLTLPGTRGTKRQRRCDRFSFLAHV